MFLNAFMLAGIGGAMIPLILHLLSRARYRSVDWGAMMFLHDAGLRQQHTARLRQWLLLLTRMAIVALLAVALARPVVSAAGWGALAGEASTTAVIIIDTSASMGSEISSATPGRTRLDAAKDAALRILSNLPPSDRVAMLPAGSADATATPVAPTGDLQAVASAISALKVSPGDADVAESLASAAALLERREHAGKKLFLICDAQAWSWRNVSSDFSATWRQQFGAAPASQVYLVTIGEGGENVAVDNLELLNPPAIAGVPATFEVTVHNYGTAARSSLPLTVKPAGQKGPVLYETKLDLSGGSVSRLRFSTTFAAPGQQMLQAAIGAAPGTLQDDHFALALDVVPPLSVLIISGDERPEPFKGESAFFRAALMPFASAGRKGSDLASVEVRTVDQWTQADLAARQVLVLANVGELAPQQVRLIEQFVSSGGGLLVAPGGLSRTDAYNRSLCRQGTGILPATLLPAVAADGSQATSLLKVETDHPIFRFLNGQSASLPPDPISRYFIAQLTQQPGARVLATYRSGQPFLIESTYGRGRVLLMTTSLDADWSTLPLTKFYLPLAQSMTRYLAAGGMRQRNADAGQELRLLSEDTPADVTWRVRRPDGSADAATVLEPGAGRQEVSYAKTQVPGTYVFRARSGGKIHDIPYVVRRPREESNPAPLSASRSDELSQSLHLLRIEPTDEAIAAAVDSTQSSRELWPALLIAVMVLAMGEVAMARWWSEAR